MQCTTITAEVDNIVEDDDMVQLTLTSSSETIATASMAVATVIVIDDSGMSVCVVFRDSQRCGPQSGCHLCISFHGRYSLSNL